MKLKNIYRIAKWETFQTTPSFTIRSILLTILLVSVFIGAGMFAVGQDTTPNEDIYTVGVDSNNQYYQVLDAADPFRVVEPNEEMFSSGEIDILIKQDQDIRVQSTTKGEAALTEFQKSVSEWNDQTLKSEKESVAYPVRVNIEYVTDSSSNTGIEENTDNDSDENVSNSDSENEDSDEEESLSVLDSLIPNSNNGVGDISSPSSISPPFPFKSVVFALLYLIPLNFVAQAYSSNIMKERINNRGELLLVTPISRGDIVVGKTLPYFIAMISVISLISLLTGGGLISIIAMVPIVIVFLASVFIAALIARSYKELTFMTVAISVGLIAYSFIPALFSDIHPIALVSPLTIVVQSIDGGTVSAVEFAFSTIPLTVTGLIMFMFGAGMYREEDLFSQKPIHETLLDSVSNSVSGLVSIGVITAFTLPFVFALQLLALSMLFPLPPNIAIIVLFVFVAIIEEIAKSIHIYAGFKNGKLDKSLRTAIFAGGMSGIGFFVAEKVTVITQFIGLQELEVGQAAFGAASSPSSPLMTIVALVFPLILHMGTAMLSAIGARKGFKKYILWMGIAMIVHLGYNLTIVASYLL